MRIEAQRLTMHFDDAGRIVEVFKDLSFSIESGSSVAIVGASGVGKTTLLYILGLLEFPVTGDVLFGTTALSDLRTKNGELAAFRGRSIGFVFQFHQLLAEFDAVENVAMPLLIAGVPMRDARSRAEELLRRVGLGHRFTHRPGMLSGGEQQRVATARALAGRPGIILADEPTGNLDHKTSSEVVGLLRELQRSEGATLIVVTHSRELAESLDRVLELTPDGIIEVSAPRAEAVR